MAAIRSRLPVPLLLLLSGCGQDAPAPDRAAPGTAPLAAGCERLSFEGSDFTVCRFDSARDEIRFVWRGPGGAPVRSLARLEAALGPEAPRVRFAMNAGMYDEEGAPIGLWVEAGRQLKPLNLRPGPGNFHLMPNGVFAIDARGRVSVTPSRAFRGVTRSSRWATQSGPMLVIAGRLHPSFARDGESRFVRNGVGVKDPRTAYFVISDDGVSFGRFARFFRDRLGCRNALFLDGSVSSLWDPAAGRKDGYSRVGPMIAVLRRP